MLDKERIRLMKKLEVTADDIHDMLEDGWPYTEEEIEYLTRPTSLDTLTNSLVEYLLEYCIDQEVLDDIIMGELVTWHKDQSNIGS